MSHGRLTGAERVMVPATLWLSFLANDGEELLTMARTRDLPQRHVEVAVAAMGLLCGAAVVDGWRTAGAGRLYQDVQLVFGLHGYVHVAESLVTRSYASGVLTSPTVVIPQGLWARSRLARVGVPTTSRPLRAAVLVGGWLAVAHALGAMSSRAHSPARDGHRARSRTSM